MFNESFDYDRTDRLLKDIGYKITVYEAFGAVVKGDLNIVKQLVNKDNVNISVKDGITLIYMAAQYGWPEILEFLIKIGAYVNGIPDTSIYKSGITPLHFASAEGHLECVEQLIAAGANVNATSIVGETPYSLASKGEHFEVAKVLKAAVANLPALTTDDKTSAIETNQDNRSVTPIYETVLTNFENLNISNDSFEPKTRK